MRDLHHVVLHGLLGSFFQHHVGNKKVTLVSLVHIKMDHSVLSKDPRLFSVDCRAKERKARRPVATEGSSGAVPQQILFCPEKIVLKM